MCSCIMLGAAESGRRAPGHEDRWRRHLGRPVQPAHQCGAFKDHEPCRPAAHTRVPDQEEYEAVSAGIQYNTVLRGAAAVQKRRLA